MRHDKGLRVSEMFADCLVEGVQLALGGDTPGEDLGRMLRTRSRRTLRREWPTG